MGVPLDKGKYGRPVVMSAAEVLRHRQRMGIIGDFRPPEAVILCYQPALLAYAAKRLRGKKRSGFYGEFYLLRRTGRKLGVVGNFGVGAPATAVLLEDLATFGVKRFISLGIAGGIQEEGKTGDLVIAEQALRDEGTSYHYLPAERAVPASRELTRKMEQVLRARGEQYACGTSWTIDAPYRETWQERTRNQEAGVLTVEMEAAALYAVAQVIGVDACAAFCIADTVTGGQWGLDYDPNLVDQGLRRLFDIAVQALLGGESKSR